MQKSELGPALPLYYSYDRLLDITKDISEAMLKQYERDGVFLPSNLKMKPFTAIAKDNTDVNAKSSGASKHFHGTSMSVLQFPMTTQLISLPPIEIDKEQSKSKSVDALPRPRVYLLKNLCGYHPVDSI